MQKQIRYQLQKLKKVVPNFEFHFFRCEFFILFKKVAELGQCIAQPRKGNSHQTS